MTDYWSLNKQLENKTYPLSIIGKTMQNLELLQYATSIDINMRYYTIKILLKVDTW